MKAVRIHGIQDVRVDEIPAPALAPGKVILAGGFTGICGSDLHMFFAPEAFFWDFTRPAPLTGATWPQILGHEFSGTIVAVADDVREVAVGDNVAVFPYHTCGECPGCRSGNETLCELIAFEGIQGVSGGMAQRKLVDAASCIVLPPEVDLRLGALVEPMAVAWHGVGLSQPDPEGGALIVGGGPIGVGAYFALKARGVRVVVVSEPSAQRRAALTALGVQHVVDPTAENLVERVRAVIPGGARVAIDCAGVPEAFPDALLALGMAGRMVVVAAYERSIEFDPVMLRGDKTIRNSLVYTREDFEEVIAAMSQGVYRVDTGWTKTLGFDGVEAALHSLRAGEGMKILVETPSPPAVSTARDSAIRTRTVTRDSRHS